MKSKYPYLNKTLEHRVNEEVLPVSDGVKAGISPIGMMLRQ